MRTVVLSLVLLPVLSGLSAFAQPPQPQQRPQPVISTAPPVEDFKPATTNQLGR